MKEKVSKKNHNKNRKKLEIHIYIDNQNQIKDIWLLEWKKYIEKKQKSKTESKKFVPVSHTL